MSQVEGHSAKKIIKIRLSRMINVLVFKRFVSVISTSLFLENGIGFSNFTSLETQFILQMRLS